MPFDVRDFPDAAGAERAAASRDRRLVAAWLFTICGMILIMVILGGITRLTGSGLSIMEWAPLGGALPPLSHSEWEKLFALYQTIPQYELLHAGFGLAGFKHIFWLEWMHRLWGRLIGIAFFVPLLWFWATGRLQPRLRTGLLVIFLIGGLQGAVGWFMVASGFFPNSISVAPYRLAIHFTLALALYSAVLWCALSILTPVSYDTVTSAVPRRLVEVFCGVLVLTVVAGSFVAGTHAGFEYNTFPLMEGRLIPGNYGHLAPFVRNLTANPAAVQFDHRLLATITTVSAAIAVIAGLRTPLPRLARGGLVALGLLVTLQYALGVATLVLVVPIPLAVAHQANAILVLTAAIVVLHALRESKLRSLRPRVPAMAHADP